MYPRHNIHSGRLLWDRGFENTYLTVLNEFHVENITYFFENPTFLPNWSYNATDSLGGPRECIQDIISTVEDFFGNPDLKHVFHCFDEFHVENIIQFFEILTFLQNWSYIATNSRGGTQRVYPRHIFYGGRLLWDHGFENTYFTVLKEFHVKNIT